MFMFIVVYMFTVAMAKQRHIGTLECCWIINQFIQQKRLRKPI